MANYNLLWLDDLEGRDSQPDERGARSEEGCFCTCGGGGGSFSMLLSTYFSNFIICSS